MPKTSVRPSTSDHPATGHRIRMLTVDGESDEEVQRRDLVKGYEFRKGKYLSLSEEELSSVKVESSSVMNIGKFVEVHSIDPVYFVNSYYLTPDVMSMLRSTRP
jgi:DNA end-binding protein Ku